MIISNLLKRNNYKVTYPTQDINGDIDFAGKKFSLETTEIKFDMGIKDEEDDEWLY